jgi:formate dehydrogenase major subunit
MTNHWIDLKNANAFLIMGSNAVENHPIASAHIWKAKDLNNATIIHVDPRFTRTSAKADLYAPIRSGTDIAFLGGMVRWIINKWETTGQYMNQQYVEDCTNALFKVDTNFKTSRNAANIGNFSASSTWDYQYDADYVPYTTWAASSSYSVGNLVMPITLNGYQYRCTVAGTSGGSEPVWPTTTNPPNTVVDGTVTWQCIFPNVYIRKPKKATLPTGPGTGLNDPDCVFQKLKEQYSVYTPAMVEKICGTPAALFEQICETYCGKTYADDKAGAILYAMGWTQHTVGSQNVRASTLVQLLLGNIGVAGGGVDALRGWHNVQGATDHCFLYHILPGYLNAPQQQASHAQLGIGPLDPSPTYLSTAVPIAKDPDAPTAPQSSNWWGMFANQYDRARYMNSLLRAWWPTIDYNTSYTYLPKRAADYSYLSLINAIDNDTIKGLFAWGTNPLVMGPDQNFERAAFDKLEWLVVCDLFEIETADFWKRPGVDPTTINTEVYLLPGAAYFEKEGSASNSGRLMQWRDKACNPPKPTDDPTYPDSGAKDELDIVNDLGATIKALYSTGLPKNAGIENLAWPVGSLITTGTLAEKVAKECNGYALSAFTSDSGAVSYVVGQQIANFFHLKSTGETACGNWLFCGTWPSAGNQIRNRDPIDYHPSQIGIHHKWGYSWPVNRRIIYNRASVYQSGPNIGLPLAGTASGSKWVVWWTGANWNGGCTGTDVNDVVDGFGTAGPQTWLPYIMLPEGVAHLMGIKALADGPFPEHWEPKETPLTTNPLTSGVGPLISPYAYAYPGALYAAPGSSTYPIVCTTYRLTEHWHGGGCTRNCPTQCEMMPEPFIELSEELAAIKGINNGDNVLVTSIRGSITVKACVTKRFKPFVIDGQTVHQVGMPWHWGWAGLCDGASANVLTPYIGDANTRIPETKVFLVNIAKA